MKAVIHFCASVLLFLIVTRPLIAEDRVKVGISTALTGNAALYGIDLKNTLLFANKKLTNNKYDLIFEDDRCNGKDAVSVAQRFTDVSHVKYVLGFACSSTLLSAAPIYDRTKTLVIASSASAPAISDSGDYIFRTWPSDTAAARKLYEYTSKRFKRIGILNEQTDYSQGILKAFQEANKDPNVTIISEDFLTDTTDLRSILLKIQSQKVDVLILNTQTEVTFLAAFKQYRELGTGLPLYGIFFPGSQTFLDSAKESANGIMYVDFPSPDEAILPSEAHLYEEFNKEYGGMKSLPVVFLTTFEAMRALHLALESGKDPKEFLYNTVFHGIFGDWRFDEKGDMQGLSPMMRIIKDQRSVRLPD